jgi:hypothetical protein
VGVAAAAAVTPAENSCCDALKLTHERFSVPFYNSKIPSSNQAALHLHRLPILIIMKVHSTQHACSWTRILSLHHAIPDIDK